MEKYIVTTEHFLCVCVSEYYGAGAQMACWLAPSFHPMHAPWLVCQPFLSLIRSLARPEKAIRSGTQLYMYGCNSSSLPCPPPSGAASHIFTICRRMTERDGERRNATQRHSGSRRDVPLATGTGRQPAVGATSKSCMEEIYLGSCRSRFGSRVPLQED